MNSKNINHSKNLDETKKLLFAAITDLSANIKFLDTKIALIMTTSGIILSGLITCRTDCYYVYQSWNGCHFLFLFFLGLYAIFLISTFVFALLCIKNRNISIPELGNDSIWYINFTDEDLKFQDFLQRVKINDDSISILSQEVYKLNKINYKKQHYAKKAIFSITSSCITIFLFALISCYYYLFI
jgi:hypothetical protein